jgi:hypothetical protein
MLSVSHFLEVKETIICEISHLVEESKKSTAMGWVCSIPYMSAGKADFGALRG